MIPTFEEIAKHPPEYLLGIGQGVNVVFTMTNKYVARWHAEPGGKPELRVVIPTENPTTVFYVREVVGYLDY